MNASSAPVPAKPFSSVTRSATWKSRIIEKRRAPGRSMTLDLIARLQPRVKRPQARGVYRGAVEARTRGARSTAGVFVRGELAPASPARIAPGTVGLPLAPPPARFAPPPQRVVHPAASPPAAAAGLTALAASLACFLRVELMGRSLAVRGPTALGRDLALPLRVHPGKASAAAGWRLARLVSAVALVPIAIVRH